jgi:hypothetical protein
MIEKRKTFGEAINFFPLSKSFVVHVFFMQKEANLSATKRGN